MEIRWSVFQAMNHCAYKAWKIHSEGIQDAKVGDLPINPTGLDKTALIAYLISQPGVEKKELKVTKKAEKLANDVKTIAASNTPPVFFKNSHCSECQFWRSCKEKLIEKDCISLLGGMSPAVLEKYHKKGITTILQLSHLFKLRRRRGNRPHISGSYLWELKALALREKKTYVLQAPEIKPAPVSIYLDYEGLPENNFIYLIGGLINQEGTEIDKFSYWTNEQEGEESIFRKLYEKLQLYPEAPIYHYGSYELKGLQKWKKVCKEQVESIEKRMINIVSFFRTHVYPPTYTNGLKEVAGFLGFEWTDKEADGLKSIEWRKNWEASAGEKWKAWLIEYNMDDCYALAVVHNWFKQLSVDGDDMNVQQVSKMKKNSPYKWQHNSEYSEDFRYINKAAYFDYQRSKIYWRKGRKSVAAKAPKKKDEPKHHGRGQHVWQPKKVNEIIQIPPLKKCPICGHKKVYHLLTQRKYRITDLKFTAKGIKQWVIEYHSGKGKCAKCRTNYNDSVLRQVGFGDNLFAWSVNLYVNYRVSFAMISRMLREQFGIWANATYFNERNYYWWTKFKPVGDSCWQTIRNSPVIHIDETNVRLTRGKDRGYVWVFATPDTVYFHLTLTRESGFLQEWMKDYHGVIVTDFFAGYETLSVKRQKCLIHLIRDLNDDLFKAPFDTEFKEIVMAFGQLLKQIVLTIDRYGLKRYHLKKHLRDTGRFFKKYVDAEYKGELSIKYAKRFKKHWPELWIFLEHDGVPWNNNNAEAAIKAFAVHRRGVNGQVSENGLKEYLSMLTVAQTCRYRGLSFLDFMRGKEKL